MPTSKLIAPRTRPRRPTAKPRLPAAQSHSLVVIDHDRLQNEAWAEFHTVRKRLDKAARELHRHEEVDLPAFDAWLHRTFPVQVTTLRELNEEVTAKTLQIRTVETAAARTGRSHKRLWHEQKARMADPEGSREKTEAEREADFEDDDAWERRQEARPEDFAQKSAKNRTAAARDTYRRLVQRIHPDRGGVWSAKRQQLWHEVQQAWSAGDGDWLARLEVEWETAHEGVTPRSPLSRLRAAIEELHAARRDIEHKLSQYRPDPAWRFTRTTATRARLERRIEADFIRELAALRRQLHYLNTTIAAWEEDWTRPGTRIRPRRRATSYRSMRP